MFIDMFVKKLADVLNYCILMADVCGLDMDEIRQNNQKYPVEKAKDSAKKMKSKNVRYRWKVKKFLNINFLKVHLFVNKG